MTWLSSKDPSRCERKSRVEALPQVAADEPGLEVAREDAVHHLLGARVALENRQVALQQLGQFAVAQVLGRHAWSLD
jgi:hypothetical protein